MDAGRLFDTAWDALTGRRFDPRMVRNSVIDTGENYRRAVGIADRLNAVRAGQPKLPVVLWSPNFAAVTLRGPWIYVARGLMERLSDDALAFVLAHEMAHHDLRHLNPALIVASWMGHGPRAELLADAEAFRISTRAGFSRTGGLETFDDALWEDEEGGTEPRWPAWIERFRTSHPPMDVRRDALRKLASGQ